MYFILFVLNESYQINMSFSSLLDRVFKISEEKKNKDLKSNEVVLLRFLNFMRIVLLI